MKSSANLRPVGSSRRTSRIKVELPEEFVFGWFHKGCWVYSRALALNARYSSMKEL